MVTCAQITADGFLAAYTATDVQSCQFVMVTPYEYEKFLSSPFALTITDSLQLGGGIALLWASAWSVKAVYLLFRGNENEES